MMPRVMAGGGVLCPKKKFHDETWRKETSFLFLDDVTNFALGTVAL